MKVHRVSRDRPELQPMAVQYTGHVIQSCQQTSRAHKNEKLFNLNINWDKPKFLRLLWDIVVF